MTNKMRSFVKGLMAGLVSRAQMPKGEPVAWLYNGVRLPDIYSVYTPELQEQYPKCAIAYSLTAEVYWLLLFDADSTKDSVTDYAKGICFFNTYHYDGFKLENDQWVSGTTSSGQYLSPKWANYDVCYADGTVYLTASEPVPVYE